MEQLSPALKHIFEFLDQHKVLLTSAGVTVCAYLTFRRYMQGGVCRVKDRLDGKTVLITGANTGIGLATAKDLAKRVCAYLTFRRYMQGGVCRSKARLDGKTVLITGANTGIGFATAKDLARRGARVLIACRNKEKGDIALDVIRDISGNNKIALYILDLSSLESVRQCAVQINSYEERLDVLINNAGAMWTSHRRTVDGFEMHLGINHLGPFLFTNLLLDLIKKSAPSRIINVSAGGHKLLKETIRFEDINMEKNFSAFPACLQSKLANILFTVELSERLQVFNLTVNSLHPGVVDTEMIRLIDDANFIVRILFKALFYISFKPFIKSPMAGAQTSIYLAVDPDVANITGKYFSDCRLDTPSEAAQDKEAAARLWTLSSQMVGLSQS